MSVGTPSMGQKVASGLRWSIVDVGLQQVMRFVITVVLTRLVAPSDFGLLGMALVFTQLASLIGDLGLGPALVQRKVVDRVHIVTAFTTTVLVGAGLTVLVVGLSWPIAAFYGEPGLQPIVAALAFNYLLRGISGTPRDLIRRDMAFQRFVVVSGTAVVTGGFLGVLLALDGAGVWALVVSVLGEAAVGAGMALGLAWRSGVWTPGWGINRVALRDLARFGAFVSGSRVAYFGASNIDNLIVGKVLGATALGYYNLAYRVMLFPILRVADVVANVTMPALSTMQDDLPRIASAFRKAVTYVCLVCLPVSVGTAIAAPVLIPTVFGHAWVPATVTVQVLAVNGVRLAVGRLNGTVYEAIGRPSLDFGMLSLTFVAYLVAFVVGVNWGIEGVAWGFTIAGYGLVPVDQYLINRALRTSPSQLLGGTVPIVAATALMGIAAGSVLVLSSGGNDLVRSILVVVVSAGVYGLSLRALAKGAISSAVGTLTR